MLKEGLVEFGPLSRAASMFQWQREGLRLPRLLPLLQRQLINSPTWEPTAVPTYAQARTSGYDEKKLAAITAGAVCAVLFLMLCGIYMLKRRCQNQRGAGQGMGVSATVVEDVKIIQFSSSRSKKGVYTAVVKNDQPDLESLESSDLSSFPADEADKENESESLGRDHQPLGALTKRALALHNRGQDHTSTVTIKLPPRPPGDS